MKITRVRFYESPPSREILACIREVDHVSPKRTT
jgi:hypothetical protein